MIVILMPIMIIVIAKIIIETTFWKVNLKRQIFRFTFTFQYVASGFAFGDCLSIMSLVSEHAQNQQ